MTGKVIIFFHIRADGLLSRSDGNTRVLLSNTELPHFLSEYRGNRLPVNGISMAMKKLGRILGTGITGKELFTIAVDVEVPGEEDIRYDVARNRVVGSGVITVRSELRRAIIKGLQALNVMDRLDEETRLTIEVPKRFDHPMPEAPPKVDPEVLSAVRELIPPTRWPIGMHHSIATRLGIAPSLAYRAITALLVSGQVMKSTHPMPGMGIVRKVWSANHQTTVGTTPQNLWPNEA